MRAASLVLVLLGAASPGAATAAQDASPSAPDAAPPAPPAALAPLALPAPPALPAAPCGAGCDRIAGSRAARAARTARTACWAVGGAAVFAGLPSSLALPSEAGAGPMASVAVGPEAPRSSGKSPLIAFSLSCPMPIAVVTVGVLMDPDEGSDGAALAIFGGIIIGPSTGWLYAGRPGLAALTAGMRLGGGLLIRVLDERTQDTTLPVLGLAVFAAATVIDWIGPALSVANANARAAKATVVPTVTPGGGAGLSLAGTF